MALSLARSLRSVAKARPAAFNLARTYAEGEGATLSLTFGTPRQAFFDGVAVNQVDVPSTTGCFGLLANHVPTIAALKPGKLTVYSGGNAQHFIVSSGTVTVNGDSSCQILAEEAAPLEKFDLASARACLDKATAAMGSALTEEDKAAAQVEVEALTSIVDAIEK